MQEPLGELGERRLAPRLLRAITVRRPPSEPKRLDRVNDSDASDWPPARQDRRGACKVVLDEAVLRRPGALIPDRGGVVPLCLSGDTNGEEIWIVRLWSSKVFDHTRTYEERGR